jgi:hypothetical protein
MHGDLRFMVIARLAAVDPSCVTDEIVLPDFYWKYETCCCWK